MDKKIQKIIALFLCVCFVLQPFQYSSATASNGVTLNLMDGMITVADREYIQKTTSGTVVTSGTIPEGSELIITGVHGGNQNIQLTGSDLPTLRFVNVSTNGYLTGNVSGTLNVIIQGNCTFSNSLIYDIATSTHLNIDVRGVDGSIYNGAFNIYGTSAASDNVFLNVSNIKVVSTSPVSSISRVATANISDFELRGSRLEVMLSSEKLTLPVLLKNCLLEGLQFYSASLVTFDNVKVLNDLGYVIIGNVNSSYNQPDSAVIKNSDMNIQGLVMMAANNKIENSYIKSTNVTYTSSSLFRFDNTTIVKGSTLEVAESLTPASVRNRTYGASIYSEDSAFIFKNSNLKRFFDGSDQFVDPKDTSGNSLYLNKLLLPGATSSNVTVSIDEREPVTLRTDNEGYLFLYLTVGSHKVKVIDFHGVDYHLEFEGAAGRETANNDNTIGELLPEKTATIITTPYKNAEIEYTFDTEIWYPVKTDPDGSFKVVIPDNAHSFYIRLKNGETKYAKIINGSLGEWESVKPVILSQSPSSVTLVKGTEGTLYVNAKPFRTSNQLAYQWFKEGEAVEGAVSNVLNIPNIADSHAGIYTCVVTESDGTTNVTVPITVTVKDAVDENELKEQIAELTEQVNQLTEQLNKEIADKQTLSDTITQLQKQISDLLKQITDLQNRVADLEEQLEETRNDNTNLNTLILELNNRVIELNTTITTLQQQLAQVIADKNALQSEVDLLRNQVISLTQQITVLNEQLIASENENTALKNEILDLRQQIIELNTVITGLNSDVNLLNQTNISLKESLDSASVTLAELEGLLTLIKAELGVNDNSDILQAIRELKGRLQEEITKNETLVNQITIIEQELNEVRANNQVLTDKLNELILLVNANDTDDLILKIAELQSIIRIANERITQLETEKSQLIKNLQDALALIDNLQKQIEILLDASGSEAELLKQIASLVNQVNQLKNKNAELSTSVTDLNTKVNELFTEKLRLEGEIARLESLLATANSTIDELRKQLADLTAERTVIKAENEALKKENERLKSENSNLVNESSNLKKEIIRLNDEITKLKEQLNNEPAPNTEIKDLKDKLAEVTKELEKVKKELEEAKKSQTVITVPETSNPLPEESVVVIPVKEDNITEIINTDVSEPQSSGKVVAKEGWQVSDNPLTGFSQALNMKEKSYMGVYSFYNNGNSESGTIPYTNAINKLTVGVGSQENQRITNKDGYVKYTFYARQISQPDKVYEYSVDVENDDYATPVTSMRSSLKAITNSYSEVNIYDVEVNGSITFTVNADFGKYGRKEIAYQLVKEDKDFDPDGNWKVVKGNTINIDKIMEPSRLYIKYTDNGDNYTVDKTVGFKPAVEKVEVKKAIPSFEMNKTIYKGYEYSFQFANVPKGSKVSYVSSNPQIASVSEDGRVKAKSKGKAVITCTVKAENETYVYTLKVAVTDGKGRPTLNLVAPNIKTSDTTPVLLLYKQIKQGADEKLTLDNITKDSVVTYMTTNADIATVSDHGVITGVKKGSTDVTVLVTQGNKHYIYYVKVRVDDTTPDYEMYTYLE
ncbi:hypothetical protein acsn021_11050 [Anaerocolumna cellulosilytica]|uniref:Uncharacterized protein n=1 Tax=Anaerocolumna cellulosilytica TaxID=433286 RepID=A0A6S6QV27_9FIRM|nr:Ig-like domain-containing protein [Anaerocolumna cellulosilytica]MBB5194592.1 putative nuclease with TOPRIM domain [Anaerocolumna cellulosilytica]BCJ93536.1 hypothetical protein acsn021_11050 [Anaerocolumna cellulosilytica]